jgi:hypothetical protein
MYLTAGDNTEILLRTIDDMVRLVADCKIDKEAAFAVIVATALHHPDHPQKKAAGKVTKELVTKDSDQPHEDNT